MRYCVKCDLSFPDDSRYCNRCGLILRMRPAADQPIPVSPPAVVMFQPRRSSPVTVSVSASIFLGVIFLFIALLLASVFFFPNGFDAFVGIFASLGEKFGQFGEALGRIFGDLGGQMGSSFGDLGSRFGGRCPFRSPSFLRTFLFIFLVAVFLILGVAFLLRSRQRDRPQNLRWD